MRTKFLFPLAVLVLALALAACEGFAPTAPRTLTVSGSGTIYLTPDMAYIYIGVHTDNSDIAQAVNLNNAQAQTLVNALKNAGVAAEDIQTSNFSVYSSQKIDPEKGQYDGYSYTVDNTVYVTVRDLTTLGSLLRAAVAAGANTINSISFDVSDKTAAMAQARQKAMDNASALAGELAQTAEVKLGEIQSISYSDYYPSYYGMGGGGATAPNASVPIQPGQQQITVTVSVTYRIR